MQAQESKQQVLEQQSDQSHIPAHDSASPAHASASPASACASPAHEYAHTTASPPLDIHADVLPLPMSDGFSEPAQESDISSDNFNPSYSMISSSSFYEVCFYFTLPFTVNTHVYLFFFFCRLYLSRMRVQMRMWKT